jgi:hypothetical protein
MTKKLEDINNEESTVTEVSKVAAEATPEVAPEPKSPVRKRKAAAATKADEPVSAEPESSAPIESEPEVPVAPIEAEASAPAEPEVVAAPETDPVTQEFGEPSAENVEPEASIVAEPDVTQEPFGKKKKEAKVEQAVQSSPSEPKKPKVSLFRRLFGWFLPKQNLSDLTATATPEDSQPQLLTADELAMSPTKLRREIAAAKRELKAIQDEIGTIEETVKSNADNIMTIDEEVQKLGSWQETISRTFVAKTQARMKLELETASADMDKHKKAVAELKVLEPGLLLKLRLAFHKSLTIAMIVCGGLIAIFSLIKFREQLPRLEWLSALYDPNLSGPIILGVVTLVIGGAALIGRKAGKQKFSLSKVIWWSVALIVIGYVIWDASQTTSFMQTYVNPWVDKHYFEILTWVGSIWAIWVASSLIVYYRGWSIFQREVDEQINGLQGVIDGYVKTQQELTRLGILHKQTNDWLRILANALFRPWRVNPDWGTSKEFSKHYETFPFALRVAQALEGNDSRMAELERIIGSHLLTQGWRDKAFDDLVKAVGEDMGLPAGKFTVDFLDQDLPHQTNNSRLLLSKYLDHSAKNPEAVEESASDSAEPAKAVRLTNQYLVKVAKTRLLTLIEKTQSHAIATARPRVEQIIDDPIVSLRSDESGLDAFDASESWDDFLTDTMGARTVDQFPLGVLSFSEAGRIKNLPSQVQSFVVVPKRLAKALPALSSDSIQIVPLGDDKPRSVEIIARIDVVGPIDFNDLQLLGSNQVPREPAAPRTKPVQDEEKL